MAGMQQDLLPCYIWLRREGCVHRGSKEWNCIYAESFPSKNGILRRLGLGFALLALLYKIYVCSKRTRTSTALL